VAHHSNTSADAARVRRLAVRYARRVNRRWDAVRADLLARRVALDEARGRLSAEVARFGHARSEFQLLAAAVRDRLKQEEAALDAQRRRAAAEWAETTDYFERQETALAARAAELASNEQSLAVVRAEARDAVTALRAEAAGLEARATHAREALEELERKRDALHAELLGTAVLPHDEPPPGTLVPLDRAADRDLTRWAADLDAREKQLAQDRAGLVAVKAGLDRQAAALADDRKVLAEQFVQLATARAEWQQAERRTVGEMEELATGLRVREQDLDAREQRVIKADARRREDGYELWQLRLRLEAWQGKLTATDQRWHAEREARDAALDRREKALAHREAEVEGVFGKWGQVRERERERLRAEIIGWADDRDRMAKAMREYDDRVRGLTAELVGHAARAMAAEEALAEVLPDRELGKDRRLEAVRKGWEKLFGARLAELDARRAAAAAERAELDGRYQELQTRLAEVVEKEGEWNTRSGNADLEKLLTGGLGEPGVSTPGVDDAADEAAARREATELAALRREVERMAAVLWEAARPEPPDGDLPWAAEDAPAAAAAAPEPAATVLPFAPINRAA
jgi:chromosome segregation ATPase